MYNPGRPGSENESPGLDGCPEEGEVMLRTALLCVLLGGTLLSSQQASVIQKQNEPCAVEGRVINSVTGAPLPRVTLALTGAARVSAETGEDGRFALQGLKAGRYTLIAQRAGYLPQAYGARSGSTSGGAGLDLAAGQQVKDVLIKLVPAAVISGRVLDESGEPATDMGVAAFQFNLLAWRAAMDARRRVLVERPGRIPHHWPGRRPISGGHNQPQDPWRYRPQLQAAR